MDAGVIPLLGGLGLFLLGMMVMTDGLRGIAGEQLDRQLARFTNGPLSGALTGAVTTALLQSSSATTVAAVGFVGAGLLTFAQALGVIFGANLGTTVTGWLVALLGLKLQIGSLVFPLILLGALMRLFARGRWQHAGLALAGFGLLFQGIAVLQAGMASYQGLVTPADFPADSWAGRLQLVAIGVAVTLITQSSSAGVATALTALYAGTISFPQAAALVIGMDVGTTVTAAVATLGGSVATRRTGYSHVVYNLLTAIGALLLLAPYAWAWERYAPGALARHAEFALVGFHSLFNLLGVLLVLPFASRFAALMYRLVPAPADPVRDRLDRHLLATPGVALDNIARILTATSAALFGTVRALLDGRPAAPGVLAQIGRDLDTVHAFADRIHLQPGQPASWRRLNAAFHLLDHLQRLHERCDEEPERALQLRDAGVLAAAAERCAAAVDAARAALLAAAARRTVAATAALAEDLRGDAGRLRAAIMAEVAAGRVDVPAGTRRLEGVRWLRRVSYHVARVVHYTAVLENDAERAAQGPVGDDLNS
ncbi:MAG: Na/Pi symporter [Gammaproteobacteria bacterium]|nr:Na/Pi symporter [Gammaproteobacteria bacterium]